MKKIFTLLAVAAMALTASAQTWYIPYTMVQDPANPDKEIAETDFVIADGVTVAEDTDCPMTLATTEHGRMTNVTNSSPQMTLHTQITSVMPLATETLNAMAQDIRTTQIPQCPPLAHIILSPPKQTVH